MKFEIGDVVKTNFMDIGVIVERKHAKETLVLYVVRSFFGDQCNKHTILESQIISKYDPELYPEYYI